MHKKQYHLAETRRLVEGGKVIPWWGGLGNKKWGKMVGVLDTQRLWDKGGGLGQRSSLLGFNKSCQIREERQFALTMGHSGGHR